MSLPVFERIFDHRANDDNGEGSKHDGFTCRNRYAFYTLQYRDHGKIEITCFSELLKQVKGQEIPHFILRGFNLIIAKGVAVGLVLLIFITGNYYPLS